MSAPTLTRRPASRPPARRRRSPVGRLLLVLLVAALALLWFLRTRAANFGDVIAVPAGAYMVSGEANARVQTALPAYVIDRADDML